MAYAYVYKRFWHEVSTYSIISSVCRILCRFLTWSHEKYTCSTYCRIGKECLTLACGFVKYTMANNEDCLVTRVSCGCVKYSVQHIASIPAFRLLCTLVKKKASSNYELIPDSIDHSFLHICCVFCHIK